MLLFETLLCLAVGIVLAVLLVTAYTSVMSLVTGFAFVFSKAAVSLVVAFILHSVKPLMDNAFASYGIWAAISLGVCFLICILPRIDCAFDFVCRVLVTLFFTKAAVDTVTGIFGIDPPPVGDAIVTFATRLVVIVLSGSALVKRVQEKNLGKFRNIVVVTVDRAISSLIYGIALYLLLINQLPISFPEWIFPVAVVVFTVSAFVVDCVYLSKKV